MLKGKLFERPLILPPPPFSLSPRPYHFPASITPLKTSR